MKILFLGGNLASTLSDWLKGQGEDVLYTEEKIDINLVEMVNPDLIISYNYKYIIPSEIVKKFYGKIINLHISYLPYNRGYYPNVWSFLDNTPKGVTIHLIDEGVDTGDILLQKEVFIDEENETLKSSYNKLHEEIQLLFKKNWHLIKEGKILPKKQKPEGNIHFKREYEFFEPFIREKGWDTPIKELKEKFRIWKRKQNEQRKNNKNI